jgi:hypothetical protein
MIGRVNMIDRLKKIKGIDGCSRGNEETSLRKDKRKKKKEKRQRKKDKKREIHITEL